MKESLTDEPVSLRDIQRIVESRIDKHTSGPWTFTIRNGQGHIDAAGWGSFAQVVTRMAYDEVDCAAGVANTRVMAAASAGLRAAVNAYVAILQRPTDVWRVENQSVYCDLRDYIAKALNVEAEYVQRYFENLASG